ncbi:hypothetical protein [Cetobacterium sp.]|uniref:hypothetical protein n=1 Tax=Cetobacterium sp. TaxID=2071632 RepID=UPI003F3320D9
MEIKNLKIINKNNIIAIFDVKFNSELEIYGFKLAKDKKDKSFIGFKSVKNWKDEWESIGKMGKNTEDRIKVLVMEEIARLGNGE